MKIWRDVFIKVTGLCLIVIGIFSIVGRFCDIASIYRWEDTDPGMAYNTALCIIIIGACFLLEYHNDGNGRRKGPPLPLLWAFAILIALPLQAGTEFDSLDIQLTQTQRTYEASLARL